MQGEYGTREQLIADRDMLRQQVAALKAKEVELITTLNSRELILICR